MKCYFCGEHTITSRYCKETEGYVPICDDCEDRRDRAKIEEQLKSVHRASDFKDWKKRDMSEAFWIHLGKYQKHPNKHSLAIIRRAYLWACHDDHGLSNSFYNAMKWCKLDLSTESERTDLPEV